MKLSSQLHPAKVNDVINDAGNRRRVEHSGIIAFPNFQKPDLYQYLANLCINEKDIYRRK